MKAKTKPNRRDPARLIWMRQADFLKQVVENLNVEIHIDGTRADQQEMNVLLNSPLCRRVGYRWLAAEHGIEVYEIESLKPEQVVRFFNPFASTL